MVHARLHVICGICGSGDDFKLKLEKDIEGQHVWLSCDNCATLHDLQDNAVLEKSEDWKDNLRKIGVTFTSDPKPTEGK